MSVNYFWTFPKLFVKLIDGSLIDVVLCVMWKVDGIDGDTNIGSSMTGIIELSPPDLDNFTAYENITYDQVSKWVFALIDKESIQTELSNVVGSKINLGIIAMPPPFNE